MLIKDKAIYRRITIRWFNNYKAAPCNQVSRNYYILMSYTTIDDHRLPISYYAHPKKSLQAYQGSKFSIIAETKKERCIHDYIQL